jgi:ubiquinone/menaquinone biosynthesis C-methylase UbiE
LSATHGRRYGSPAERLRSPERIALLEVPRVLDLGLEGIAAVRVLDVGTGTGIFAEAFLARGLEVTGIDPNADLLSVARRFAAASRFEVGTAETLPFEDGSFDLVMMGHVLHETDDPVRALSEAKRVSRQRVAVLEWPYVDEDKGPPLAHRLKPSEIEDLARRAGFSAVERIDLSHMQLYRLTP